MTINSIAHDLNEFDDLPPTPPEPAAEEVRTTKFFHTIAEAMTAAAPPESNVRTVGFDDATELLKAGYRVDRDDTESYDVVIAKGGLVEFGIAQKISGKRLILVPTRDFAAAASPLYRATDTAFALVKRGRKPFAAVFDPELIDGDLAATFGEIAALDLAAFDYSFGSYMRGDGGATELVSFISERVASLAAELKPLGKTDPAVKRAIVKAGEDIARGIEPVPELLFASGATQVAEALRMLFTAEDRPIARRGELEMLLGSILIDFYIKSRAATALDFPPDNGKRIDSICEFFNVDVRRACVYAAPIYPPFKMRLCEYRRREFGQEQTRMLVSLRERHKTAVQVFKRLYPDDGYGLKTLFEPTDVGLCIALAPDVFAADSMLSFLKQAGKLEKYMI